MSHLDAKSKLYHFLLHISFKNKWFKNYLKKPFCLCSPSATHAHTTFIVVCFLRQIKIRCRRCAKIRLWQLRVQKDDPSPRFQGKQRKRIAARDRHLYRRKEKHQKIYTGFRFILQIADRGEREDKKDNLRENP